MPALTQTYIPFDGYLFQYTGSTMNQTTYDQNLYI